MRRRERTADRADLSRRLAGGRVWSPSAVSGGCPGRCRARRSPPDRAPRPGPGSSSPKPKAIASLMVPSWSSVSCRCPLPTTRVARVVTPRKREQRLAVGGAEGRQPRQLFGKGEVEIAERHLGVDLDRRRGPSGQLAGGLGGEGLPGRGRARSMAMLIPAAPAWPPNLVRWALQAPSASNRFTPGTVRAEPRPSPFLKPMAIAGRASWSTRRAAMIPTTPWCHPSAPTTTAGASACVGRLRARLHPDQLLDSLPLGVLLVDRLGQAGRVGR